MQEEEADIHEEEQIENTVDQAEYTWTSYHLFAFNVFMSYSASSVGILV